MRRTTFVETLILSVCLFYLFEIFMICPQVSAQGTTQAIAPANAAPGAVAPSKNAPAPGMPSDPKQLMLLAAKANNLTGDGIKPWHLKASYTLYDENGSVKDQGTFDEFWTTPDKYKLTTTGQKFVQTDFGTKDGIRRSGQEQELPQMLTDALRELVAPLPALETIHRSTYSIQNKETGNTSLSCLTPDPHDYDAPLVYCLAGNPPAARADIYNTTGLQALRNRILHFGDRTVAGDVVFKQSGKLLLAANIENLEFIDAASDVIFTPSVDALPLPVRPPRHIAMSAGMARGLLVKPFLTPDLTRIANGDEISGTVVLHVTIGVDGHVRHVYATSGPPMLQKISQDAARMWVYKAYVSGGAPVEVETVVNLAFQFTDNASHISGTPPKPGVPLNVGAACAPAATPDIITICISR